MAMLDETKVLRISFPAQRQAKCAWTHETCSCTSHTCPANDQG